jgi:hypothetical protein
LLREPFRIKPLLDRPDGLGHLLARGFDVGGDHLWVGIGAGSRGTAAPAISPHV